MNLNLPRKSIAILVMATATTAMANNVNYDYATVIEATPILKTVEITTPQRECWDEQVRVDERNVNGPRGKSHLAPVVGGIVGGALGNAVGHRKKNKQVGTFVGAVLGATIGHAMTLDSSYQDRRYQEARSRRADFPRYRIVEQCEVRHVVHEEERIDGYSVRYRYAGETYSTRMEADPGDSLRVRVAVSPVF